MDVPKPALRPPIQPPGLFYLLPCGLLTFDLECGEFHAFEEEVANLKNDPAFMDRVFAAYGRFYSAKHQVILKPFCYPPAWKLLCNQVYVKMWVTTRRVYCVCCYWGKLGVFGDISAAGLE